MVIVPNAVSPVGERLMIPAFVVRGPHTYVHAA